MVVGVDDHHPVVVVLLTPDTSVGGPVEPPFRVAVVYVVDTVEPPPGRVVVVEVVQKVHDGLRFPVTTPGHVTPTWSLHSTRWNEIVIPIYTCRLRVEVMVREKTSVTPLARTEVSTKFVTSVTPVNIVVEEPLNVSFYSPPQTRTKRIGKGCNPIVSKYLESPKQF